MMMTTMMILVMIMTGIEVLNGAIDTLRKRVPPEKWKYVNVTIAPSTITIVEHEVCMCWHSALLFGLIVIV